LKDENILSNEIYSLLTGLKLLRKLDLTNCSIGKPSADFPMRRNSALSTIGTVMRAGKTHLSRISLGKNKMSEADLSKLIHGIKEHKKSIKELYLNDCGLEKDMIELVLKTLYEKNPEQVIRLDLSVDIKHGVAIDPELLQQMIPYFKRLETLRMRGYNLLSMNYNFNLESSHLHELDLGGSRMNSDIVNRLCKWIQTPSFQTIEELSLGDCNLNGKHVYDILQSISQSGNRAMHLNLECNPIMKEIMHLPKLHSAVLQGEGPKSVSFARIEWDDSTLREFIDCLRDNQTISHIDLSDISMKDTDEISEDTIRMLTSLFERNTHITELELNYKFNRTPNSPFTKSQPKSLVCDAIVQALNGLRHNVSLQHLDISGLNFEDAGAMALSRVLKTNRSLQSIILDENNVSSWVLCKI
jgi:Ran GTPase-activating protein (RanGAP) involved in mRNA processing and transport